MKLELKKTSLFPVTIFEAQDFFVRPRSSAPPRTLQRVRKVRYDDGMAEKDKPISHLTVKTNNLPQHLHVFLVERFHVVILGLQTNHVLLVENAFDGCGLTVDERHDDLAFIRGILLAHYDVVAVEDADVYHAVAVDVQHEKIIIRANEA